MFQIISRTTSTRDSRPPSKHHMKSRSAHDAPTVARCAGARFEIAKAKLFEVCARRLVGKQSRRPGTKSYDLTRTPGAERRQGGRIASNMALMVNGATHAASRYVRRLRQQSGRHTGRRGSLVTSAGVIHSLRRTRSGRSRDRHAQRCCSTSWRLRTVADPITAMGAEHSSKEHAATQPRRAQRLAFRRHDPPDGDGRASTRK